MLRHITNECWQNTYLPTYLFTHNGPLPPHTQSVGKGGQNLLPAYLHLPQKTAAQSSLCQSGCCWRYSVINTHCSDLCGDLPSAIPHAY